MVDTLLVFGAHYIIESFRELNEYICVYTFVYVCRTCAWQTINSLYLYYIYYYQASKAHLSLSPRSTCSLSLQGLHWVPESIDITFIFLLHLHGREQAALAK